MVFFNQKITKITKITKISPKSHKNLIFGHFWSKTALKYTSLFVTKIIKKHQNFTFFRKKDPYLKHKNNKINKNLNTMVFLNKKNQKISKKTLSKTPYKQTNLSKISLFYQNTYILIQKYLLLNQKITKITKITQKSPKSHQNHTKITKILPKSHKNHQNLTKISLLDTFGQKQL